MPEPDANGARSPDPVAASRTPPLPAGTTIVWRARVSVPPDLGNVDVLAVDPARFAEVAAWGTGPELARARAAARQLGDADATSADRLRSGEHAVPVPALAVGDVGLAANQRASLLTASGPVPIAVRDHLSAFPGHDNALGLIVVPADSFFLSLGADDPRLRPPEGSGRFNRAPADYFPSLWARGGPGAIASVTGPSGVRTTDPASISQVALRPELVAARRSLGPQLALGVLVAMAAALVLVMYADRRARSDRAADVLLARMGLGRSGVVGSRAGELALVAGLGLLGGLLGALALTPFGARLLDPGGGVAPAFALRRPPWELLALGLVTVSAWAAAAGLVLLRVRGVDEAGVLRDAE